MAGQYAARLGVILGLDMAEFTAGIDKAIAENKKLKASIQRETNAAAKEIIALKYATEDYGKSITKVDQIQRDIGAGGRLANATKEVKDMLLQQAAAYDAVAIAAKKSQIAQLDGLTKQQKIGVGYQTTDIVTSLAGGQNPLLVLIQQGGQLKDLFGGIGPMFRALGTFITPVSVAVTTVAAAIGTLAYSYYLGSEESKKFNNNLILTGNYAGITYDKYNELAAQIAKTGQISVGNSKDIVNALASSGKFTESTFASVGKAIALVSRLSGENADSVAKELIPAFDGSAQAAASLSEKYHFLSLAQYKELEILDRQKDKEAAIKLVSDALSDSIDEQGNKLGYLTKAWNVFKDALESFKGIGASSLEKDLARLKEDLSQAKEGTDFYKQTLLEIEQLEKRIDDRRAKAITSNAEQRKMELWKAAGGDQKYNNLRFELEKQIIELVHQNRMQGLDELARIEEESNKKIGEAKRKQNQADFAENRQFALQNKQIYEVTEAAILAEKKQKQEELQAQERKMFFDRMSNDLLAIQTEEMKAKLYRANVNTTEEDIQKAITMLQLQKQIRDVYASRKLSIEEKNSLVAEFELMEKRKESVAGFNKMFEMQRNNQRSIQEQLTNTENLLKLEREKLNIYEKDLFISEADYNIAVQRLQTEQEIEKIRVKVAQGKLSGEQGTEDIARLERIQTEREGIDNLATRLKMLRDVNQAVFKDMEDAIVTFVKTGKFSFNDLAKSMITNIMAIYAKAQFLQMFNTGKGLLANFFSGGSIGADQARTGANAVFYAEGGGLQGFANGGEINGPAIVGENGPELFIPKSAGTIIPNNQMASAMGGPQITYNGPYIANMQAIDTQSATQFLARNKLSVYAANQSASRSLPTSR
jgi:phage-related minor tail protein